MRGLRFRFCLCLAKNKGVGFREIMKIIITGTTGYVGEGVMLACLDNPEHWDASRPGEMDYQVRWELDHLDKADMIIMYILGTSKSPISLLEMGLHAKRDKMHVICKKNFYRYNNVRITCEYYDVPLYDDLDAFFENIGR